VAALLEEVCGLTEEINTKFESAAKLVQEKV
jgi:hypothetical protein